MYFIVIILGAALFIYWRFYRPRQLQVLVISLAATVVTMALISWMSDDFKLGIMFVLTIFGWSRLASYLMVDANRARLIRQVQQRIKRR